MTINDYDYYYYKRLKRLDKMTNILGKSEDPPQQLLQTKEREFTATRVQKFSNGLSPRLTSIETYEFCMKSYVK